MERVGVSTQSAPPTRLQLGRCLTRGMVYRVGAVAQLPGVMRMSPAAQYVETRFLGSPGITEPVCCSTHADIPREHAARDMACYSPQLPLRGDARVSGCVLRVYFIRLESLQLQHHEPRASSSYVLAASLQVWNGMMVLLGAARFGPRRNAPERPTLRGASTFSARCSCSSRNVTMLLHHPPPE